MEQGGKVFQSVQEALEFVKPYVKYYAHDAIEKLQNLSQIFLRTGEAGRARGRLPRRPKGPDPSARLLLAPIVVLCRDLSLLLQNRKSKLMGEFVGRAARMRHFRY